MHLQVFTFDRIFCDFIQAVALVNTRIPFRLLWLLILGTLVSVDNAIAGDLNDDKQVDLEDGGLALIILSAHTVSETITLDREVDGDGKVGFAEVICIMEKIAGVRDSQSWRLPKQ